MVIKESYVWVFYYGNYICVVKCLLYFSGKGGYERIFLEEFNCKIFLCVIGLYFIDGK